MSYEPTIWKKGDKVTSTKLNKIENGIQGNDSEISELKSGLSELDDRVKAIEEGGGGTGLTDAQKLAILNCFQHVAWTDDKGQTYYDELEDVLFPPSELKRITAIYSNSNKVYPDTNLEDLKPYITVTAHYSNGATETVNAYTLSGTLEVGTSTVTVTYSGKKTTISVTVVVKPKSDMTQWSDGIMYTDIEYVEDSYYRNGRPATYANWDRSGKIPCHGASNIVFEPYGDISGAIDETYCWFFKEDQTPLSAFVNAMPANEGGEQPVPSDAYYFGISGSSAYMDGIRANGFTPYA